ncbi:MAG: hypothetical protein ACOYLQ_07185 [Hyphomicrobiaceae bacterium]
MIASLSGTPSTDPFADLRAIAQRPGAAIAIHACPRPLPANEIEGVTIICGDVKVPEERSKAGGRNCLWPSLCCERLPDTRKPIPSSICTAGLGAAR